MSQVEIPFVNNGLEPRLGANLQVYIPFIVQNIQKIHKEYKINFLTKRKFSFSEKVFLDNETDSYYIKENEEQINLDDDENYSSVISIITQESRNEIYRTNIDKKDGYKKAKIFDIIHQESSFTKRENCLTLDEEDDEDEKKSILINKTRKDDDDNIRTKIKRAFVNIYLINMLNYILINNNSSLYFEKFPKSFAKNITKIQNSVILDMTLEEIFQNRDLYNEKELDKFHHNLDVIKAKEIQENKDMKNYLKKTFSELFNEYINSNTFKIDEIKRLRKKKYV
jgi:hypothetical protein